MDSKGALGIVIGFLGLVQIVGSVTGNEAAMLAALFDPTMISTASGAPAKPKASNIVSGFVGGLLNFASKVVP